jgi:IS5 family transposase
MYRKVDPTPNPPSNFDLPFEGQLLEDNRWVIMAKLIPWSAFEAEYAENFSVDMAILRTVFKQREYHRIGRRGG